MNNLLKKQGILRYSLLFSDFYNIMLNIYLMIGSEKMGDTLKTGLKLWGKTIIVCIMCFFIVISMNTIATAFFTENVGYTAYGTTSDSSEHTALYTYEYKDGEDTLKKGYEDQGYTITMAYKRSDLSTSGKVFFYGLTQVMCIILLITFVHTTVWAKGIRDNNLVKTGHKKEDVFKGLKYGLISIIPYSVFWILVIISKNGGLKEMNLSLVNLTSAQFYTLIQLIIGKAKVLGDMNYIQLIGVWGLQLIIPLISGISYYLGYKDISIGEKMVYKKKDK